MNRQWMKAGAALLTLAALGVTAGCGGAPAKSSPEKAAASGAAERTLKVACIATYPPFVYKDKEDKIIGFDVDITNAVAKEMGAKTEYKSMPFDQIVQAVADNKADIAVAACDMTQDRADKVNFSSIYYNKESVSILSRKDDERIHGSQDLSGKTVAVEKGTVYVESKEADALILDKPVALFYMTHGAADKLRSAGIISGSGGFVMLLNKKDPALQKEVNEALGKLMNNGEYDKIYDKWFADTNFEKEPDVKK